MEDDGYHTATVPDLGASGEARLAAWLQQRLGPRATDDHPGGTWTMSVIPGVATIVTATSQEVVFEMRLVEPWRP